ncbi:MAG: hypothetical protein ACOX9B_12855 [Candidatus Xenobium sp.]|nr:glycosyltransferase family 4 protein [Burkholderiales bacterium]
MTVYDMVPVTHTSLVLSGEHRLLAPIYRWQARALSRAEGLLAISQHTRQCLEAFLGQAPPIP